jgi:hypothetical protein
VHWIIRDQFINFNHILRGVHAQHLNLTRHDIGDWSTMSHVCGVVV